MSTRFIPNDDLNCMQTAEWIGEKKGRAEGRVEREREIARKMLEKGIDANIISEVTGLSIDEIEKYPIP